MQHTAERPAPIAGIHKRGSASAVEGYNPTPEEKVIINKSNKQFLGTYVLGVGIGVGTGIYMGEYVGRKIGVANAKVTLGRELPQNSQLRVLLEQHRAIRSSGQFQTPTPAIPSQDYSLEGSVPPDVPPTISSQRPDILSPHTLSRGTPEIPPIPAYEEDEFGSGNENVGGQVSGWDAIRKRNQPQGGSTWDRLRAQGGPRRGVASYNDDEENEEDEVESGSRGSVRGTVPLNDVPRTREELEHTVRSGRLKTNQYGDLME
ncbi:hypothetical protein HK104_010625 [Borealophlyctis nickersoniae]|nr:hypothetical protein HK104_010625 [Borealophlyctis nickersoniae]